MSEPLALGTGDFETVGEPAIPRAPRAPVFHRSAPPPSQPYGMYAPQSGYPQQYPQQMLSAPPPPNSLAPVAMAAMGTGRHAVGTGPHRAAETVMIKERPGMKAGFVLVVLGALVGGVLGVGMRARQNQVEASNAAAHPPAVSVPAQPTQAANVSGGPASTTQTPPGIPPSMLANLPPGAVMVDPSKGTVIPVQPPVNVTDDHKDAPGKKGEKTADAKSEKSEKSEKDNKHAHAGKWGHAPKVPADSDAAPPKPAATPRFAAKVNPPAEKAEKAPPPEKAEKPEKPAPKKSGGGDAESVLKDAMKESL